jgi:hypothetical protein
MARKLTHRGLKVWGLGTGPERPLYLDNRKFAAALWASRLCHKDICSAAKQPLFDDLIGDGEQRRRNNEAKRLGGLEVENERVPVLLLDR